MGLNDASKAPNVKRLLVAHNIGVVSILETKVKLHKLAAMQNKFGRNWSCIYNYSYSPKGRI